MSRFLFRFVVTLTVFSPAAGGAFERVSTGDTLKVACENTTIHSEASAFSNIIGMLKFGDGITAKSLYGLFELPDSDFSSRKKSEKREEDSVKRARGTKKAEPIPPETYTRASWIEIDQGKFVSNSCLVSLDNFKDQTIEKAEEKVEKIAANKGKRGFSEEEEGDMTAMRGAAGKAKGGIANYAAVDLHINMAQGKVDFIALNGFRQAGLLGEYQ